MTSLWVAALTVFAVFLIANAVVFHFFAPKKRVRAMTLILVACVPLLLPALRFVQDLGLRPTLPERLSIALLAALIFAFGWYGYIQSYFVIEWSITVQYLVHIYRSPGHRMSLSEMEALYPMKEILEHRIERLVASGVTREVETDGTRVLRLSWRGRLYGATASFLRDFMNWGNKS